MLGVVLNFGYIFLNNKGGFYFFIDSGGGWGFIESKEKNYIINKVISVVVGF